MQTGSALNYHDALSKWSRQGKIYAMAGSEVIIMDATYKSDEFRESFTTEYSRLYGLDSVEGSKKLTYSEIVANSSKEEQKLEFFVSFYTPDPKWNDLDKKNSIWNLYVETAGGNRIEPASIENISRDDARTKNFYPYIGPWSEAYVVSFKKPADLSGNFKLLAFSVKGEIEMEWTLETDATVIAN